eukprot:scaffold494953_cov44-Prasinocladus_malaysianus.AAC.1
MQNLICAEGDVINFKSATLPKGKYVKLQPHTKDFLDISNPKAVLERTLRNYSCLTVGDCILVNYNNKNYYIDIIEAKPENAVSIVETDCEVDFAPPLDYVEPEPTPLPPVAPPPLRTVMTIESYGSHCVGSGKKKAQPEPEPEPEPEPAFMAFAGSGRRLDGKAAGPSAPVPVHRIGSGTAMKRSTSGASEASTSSQGAGEPSNDGAKNSNGQPVAGKLVFGGRSGGPPKLGAPK